MGVSRKSAFGLYQQKEWWLQVSRRTANVALAHSEILIADYQTLFQDFVAFSTYASFQDLVFI